MAVDISRLEAHELASPGRWHVFMRSPTSMDAGMVQVAQGQTVDAVDWPALKRLWAGLGHEFIVARRDDGLLEPADASALEEARGCIGSRSLVEPWASLFAPEKKSDEGNEGDERQGDDLDEADSDDSEGSSAENERTTSNAKADESSSAPKPPKPRKARGKKKSDEGTEA